MMSYNGLSYDELWILLDALYLEIEAFEPEEPSKPETIPFDLWDRFIQARKEDQ